MDDGSDEGAQGHEVDPDEIVRQALEGKQGQGAGSEGDGVRKDPPAPVKPAPADSTKPDVAWFLAERDVKKSCPALDADDIEILKAAANGDPVKFVELAEKQQAKREVLLASRSKVESEDEELRKKAAQEILGGGGPGGSGSVRPQGPTPQEQVKKAVESGDSRGIRRGMMEVINKGKDGKPIFDGVRIGPE